MAYMGGEQVGDFFINGSAYNYVLENFNLKNLSEVNILKHLAQQVDLNAKDFFTLHPQQIEINFAAFSHPNWSFPMVQIQQGIHDVKLTCRCSHPKNKLCVHQAQVLYNILYRKDLLIFFDEQLRRQKLLKIAADYGLENEPALDTLFELKLEDAVLIIKPKNQALNAFNPTIKKEMEDLLLAPSKVDKMVQKAVDLTKLILVLRKHRHYGHLTVEIFEANTGRNGQVKNPLKTILPTQLMFKTNDAAALKFYSGLSYLQHNLQRDEPEAEIEALKAIVCNPLNLSVYLQKDQAGLGTQASNLKPIKWQVLPIDLRLSVNQKGDFYEITGKLHLLNQSFDFDQLQLIGNYFIQLHQTLYFIHRLDFIKVISFFIRQSNRLILHQSKYLAFQKSILIPLEGSIQVNYSYLRPANKSQLEEKGFDLENEKIIYLSESQDFVLITPVMRYGSEEIPVLSKKQIRAQDKLGNVFTVQRDEAAELQFIGQIIKQHPFFYEQESDDSFYLHRKRFLEEEWFLTAFDAWRSFDIHILGFNTLKGNTLNPHRAEINIAVLSGTDWFETKVKVKFGSQIVPLKHLHKSIRNKSKFITLDDGTKGIIPEVWMAKFSDYFNAGELTDEAILTPKIKFDSLTDIYEDALLSGEVKNEIALYRQKFNKTAKVKAIDTPKMLKTTLRPYQQEGLNWLNFLDDFNFGACLADDMGLGKTIQVLAFLLSQRLKVNQNTNLIVVPASLIFNWQAEIEKFAPSLKVLTYYGSQRAKIDVNFNLYEVILTSYGTLLSDIRFLKDYRFNYIVLDESQNIKNPDSQRYKAARLLQSRNKIVLTGTPLENNTFDLYGQLSFACPGLFGSKQHFADLYSTPIDQFKDKKRAEALQKKIAPFILRRTKAQVAKDLPEKTEIILYCEMGAEQREVYEANKKEIQDFILNKNEDELPKTTMHVLKSITQLRQICNSAALLANGKSFVQSSAKIDVLLEQIENKAGAHKILVFSQFVGMLNLIKKRLEEKEIKYAYLSGQTKNRGDAVKNFQQDASIQVFLISLKAGGTGLNLTQADYVYLVDPWWNPAVENQAIDRAYRIGQQKNVMAIRLICPDTVEEKIMKLQATKKELVSKLIRSDAAIFKQLSKADLLDLLN